MKQGVLSVSKQKKEITPLNVRGPVLVIDDDEKFRSQLEQMLRTMGVASICLESGSHCLRFIQNQPWNWYPALVLTDLVMDGMGGYHLIRRIHEQYPHRNIPVVVVSKLNASVDVGEAEAAGAVAYVTKPLDADRLHQTLDRVLNHDASKGMLVFTTNFGGERKKRSRQ